jgi:glycosyltransferase involved in cell wall biosynthesis
MKKKINVVLIQRIFAEYRKSIYDELGKYLDFKVFNTQGNSGILSAETPYSVSINQYKYGQKETNTFLFFWNKLFREKPDVIIHEFAIGILSLPLALLIARLWGKKFILWSHGYDRKVGFHPENNYGDKYRLWLMKKADSIILYGFEDKKLLSSYISPNKIFVAQNTLDTVGYAKVKNQLNKYDSNLIKQKYNFRAKYNLVTIGRIYKEKKSELLINVFKEIELLKPNLFSLHFIGDGEHLEEIKKEVSENHLDEKIIFHGAIYDEQLTGEMLFIADMMVMAGPVGLSVVHAYCFDCPVITFNQKGHGPEIEYIIHEKTGFVIDNFSTKRMAETIVEYLNNNELQSTILSTIQKKIKTELSINNMVQGVINAVNFSINNTEDDK